MATGDLTNVAAVRLWLNVKGNEHDDIIAQLITACSTFVKSWLNRDILSATYTEKRSGTGHELMSTKNYPIQSITSVTIDQVAVAAAANSTVSGFTFDEHQIFLNGRVFNKGRNNVQLVYVAGYAACPADIEQAVIETVGLRFKDRDRIGNASKSIGGETVQFIISEFTKSAQSILQQYKKVHLV